MLRLIFLVAFFVTIPLLCRCDLYVNKIKGHDSLFCGSRTKPCRTLEHALLINSKSTSYDTIVLEPVLDKTYQSASIYTIETTFNIAKDLYIKGSPDFSTKPKIILKLANEDPVFQFTRYAKLQLQSLHVLNASRLVNFQHGFGHVGIRDCNFDQASMLITNDEYMPSQISISIYGTRFHISSNILKLAFINDTSDQTISVKISKSNFTGEGLDSQSKAISVRTYQTMTQFELTIDASKFQHFSQALRVSANQKDTNFTVNNSIFIQNNMLKNKPLYCGSAIRFNGPGSIIITETTFQNNMAAIGGALCLSGTKAVLKNVNFTENLATSKGGGLYNFDSTLVIDGCSFHKNTASTSNMVSTHTNDAAGYGGAIFNVFNGDISISNSTFNDNFAFIFGGGIYHNGRKLNIVNSVFHGPTSDDKNSLHGTLLYSKNQCVLKETTFESRTSNGKGTVIFHSSPEINLEVKPKFRFQCQRGQSIIRSYNHQPEKTKFSLLMLICQSCPSGTYSLQKDTLDFNYTMHEKGSSRIKCLTCPQGGVCENGIRSLPNFWGWEAKNESRIKFLPCPSSFYCCTSNTCNSYNGCSINRGGRLCGRCNPGFSESMLGKLCIPNEACNGYMLWAIFIIISLSYVFLFMYFKDIFSLTKLLMLKPVECIQRVKSVKRSFSTNNIDDLDMFYVDIDTDGTERLIRSSIDSPLTQHSYDHIVDDSNIIDSNDLEDSCEHVVTDDDFSDNVSVRERLISDANEIKKSRATKIKIKWYSYLFGIFKILVFFYQMQLLSKVPSVLENSYKFVGPRFVKEFVTGVFNLKFSSSFSVIEEMCLFRNMNPVKKRYGKMMFIVLLFCVLTAFLLTWLFIQFCKRLIRKLWLNISDDDSIKSRSKRVPFMIRIKCCFLQLLLISYSTICTSSLELINCVEIDNISYVYINAEQKCEGLGYTMSNIIVACWSGPFFIALFFANRLLRERKVSVNVFFITLLVPPFLIVVAIRDAVRGFPTIEYSEDEKETREHVLQVLEMPFHKKNVFRSAWYWESNLIFRKLVLICIFVFFEDPISRLYTMVIPLSLFLVDHLRVQPYNIRFLNWLETASLLLLSFLVSINLFWAYNYESNVPVTKQMSLISKSFLYVETFILFLPILLVLFIIMAKLIRRAFKKIKK